MSETRDNPEAKDARRWSAVFEAAVDAVVTIDERGNIDGFNAAAERLFGYRRADVVSQNVRILMAEPDASRHGDYLARYRREGGARIIGTGRQVTARRKNGSTFPVHLSVGEFRHGGQAGYVGILHDLTAREEAKARLSEQEKILRAMFEQAPVASASLDGEGRIRHVNRVFRDLLGWPEPEVRGRKLTDLLETVGGPPSSPAEGRPCRVCDAHGKEHHMVLHLNPVLDVAGNLRIQIAQLEDHTERMRAAEEAGQHRDRLARIDRITRAGEMVSGIAHEVNQPLSAIANYSRALVRLMKARNLEDDDILDTAGKLHAQAKRAGEIIRGIRRFVAKHPAKVEALDVNGVVREVVALSALDSDLGRDRIRLELAEDLPTVRGDRIQIQQVVLNLLRNAVEADPEGSIALRTVRTGARHVSVQVEDHGKGIRPEDERHLFDPFFSTKGEGLGLGLALSRSIASSLGGSLSFSRNPDRGVTFELTLVPWSSR